MKSGHRKNNRMMSTSLKPPRCGQPLFSPFHWRSPLSERKKDGTYRRTSSRTFRNGNGKSVDEETATHAACINTGSVLCAVNLLHIQETDAKHVEGNLGIRLRLFIDPLRHFQKHTIQYVFHAKRATLQPYSSETDFPDRRGASKASFMASLPTTGANSQFMTKAGTLFPSSVTVSSPNFPSFQEE